MAGYTLSPGIYSVPGAASITGTLTFTGSGIHIIQVSGAFATAAGANVILINGATAGNIFWQVQGAVAFGAGTKMTGNIVGNAAIAVGAGCSVWGNLYTVTGAIAISGTTFTDPAQIIRIANSLMAITVSDNATEKLSMYPNPNHGKINVVYNGDKAQVTATQVYDCNMNLIYTVSGFKANIDLPTAKAGVNFILLQLKTKTLTQKFVVLKN